MSAAVIPSAVAFAFAVHSQKSLQTCAFRQCSLPRIVGLSGGERQCCRRRRSAVPRWRYYQASVAVGACEYYLGAGEQPGVWVGRGLAELGLEPGERGQEQQLEAVFARGLHPVTGARAGSGVAGGCGHRLRPDLLRAQERQRAVGTGRRDRANRTSRKRTGPQCSPRWRIWIAHAALSRRGTDGVEQIAHGWVRGGVVRPPDVAGRGSAAAHPRAGAEQAALRGRGVAHHRRA